MAFPKVSIVIPSYKPAHFEQCLRSALGQTYPNIEILVSDNCPTEEIREICARFPGVLYQRNSAIREANVLAAFYSGKGEFIKPLFDDDLLHPFCVERMVAAMLRDPDLQLVFSASQVINIENLRTETRRPYQATGSLSGDDLQRSMSLGMCNLVGEFSTMMCRRDTLWAIGPNALFTIGDHDFTKGLADVAAFCNLARYGNGKAMYIDEELSYFRHDQRLQSNSNASANPHFGNCFSDYIDLLRASYQLGLISLAELHSVRPHVEVLRIQLGEVFPQVGHAHQRYVDYLAQLPQP